MKEATFKFRPILGVQWKPKEEGEVAQGTIIDCGEKPIEGDLVPYVEMADNEGEVFEVLLGSWTLAKLYQTGELKDGRVLAIRYDGEHPDIVNRDNHLKMYSYALFETDGTEIDLRKKIKNAVESGHSQDKNDDLDRKLQETADKAKQKLEANHG